MRKQGAAPVQIAVLVVVILACIGFVVYWMGSGPPSAPTAGSGDQTPMAFKCTDAKCGRLETIPAGEVDRALPMGKQPGSDKAMRQCPQCGKFTMVKQ